MKHRTRYDIVAMILRTSLDGAKRTKIMYSTQLSYNKLMELLSVAIKKEMLEYDEKNRIYRTTAKGRAYLKNYDKIQL
ncbi:MAG TPA: winged helix-turn-helix domain-containing protein [Flavobacterium sp.]|nr:winged helix-turn-helix domain-containing protein [Flavobacterium sp.]